MNSNSAQVAKANKILGLIRKSYQFLDKESLRLLFTALVRPHLEFNNVAWSPRFQKDKTYRKCVVESFQVGSRLG